MHIDLQPCLSGPTIRLRPLSVDDFDALHSAAANPEIWAQHPDSQRYKRGIFKERFFEGAIASKGALAIFEKQSERIIGSSRFYNWRPETKEISVGYTFLEVGHWGMGTNAELKQLMLRHIYQWADVVWFHVGEENGRSRKAIEKLGAELSHDEHRELNGTPYIQLYYQLSRAQFIRLETSTEREPLP